MRPWRRPPSAQGAGPTGVPPAAGIRQLGIRQVYIWFTRYGGLFLVLLLLMLLGSMNYMSNLGHLLTFGLTGLTLVSLLHSWRNLMGLRLEGAKAEPVFAGQEALFQLQLANPRRYDRLALRLQTSARTEATEDIPAGERRTVTLRMPTRQRGELPLGRITLSTVFPLGLTRAWSYLEPAVSCLVYPAPAGDGPLPVRPAASHGDEGSCGSGADDYVGSRPYRPGDSPRHLDWKALARERGLVSKQFGGDCAERVVLDWDDLPGIEGEARLRILCRFVLMAAEQGIAFQLRLPGQGLPEGRGEAHKHRCLAALARHRIAP
jgi:uncharacterized protein (DUF58 family)